MRIKYGNKELINMMKAQGLVGHESVTFRSDSMVLTHKESLEDPKYSGSNYQSQWEYKIMCEMLPGWVLFSYSTPIAIISDRDKSIYVTRENHTVTTARHVGYAKELMYQYKEKELCKVGGNIGRHITESILERKDFLEMTNLLQKIPCPIEIKRSRRGGKGKLKISLEGLGWAMVEVDINSGEVLEYTSNDQFPRYKTSPEKLIEGTFKHIGCHPGLCENAAEKAYRYYRGW